MELIDAVQGEDLDLVNRLLLNPRVDVNQTRPNGTTPLMVAAVNGLVAIGQKLIEHGADINQADARGETPLMSAIIDNHRDFVTLLLEQEGIDVNAVSTIGDYENEGILGSRGGNAALFRAIAGVVYGRESDSDTVEMLLDSGADPNATNGSDITPLTLAIAGGRLGLVKLLIEHGADINQQNITGFSVLMKVIVHSETYMLDYFLSLPGLDIDAAEYQIGSTALMSAAKMIFFGTISVGKLLAAGADPLIESKEYKTAQLYAVNPKIKDMLAKAERIWRAAETKASQDLKQKYMVASRLRQGVTTTEGSRLELPQRQLAEGIIQKSEYDNLCLGIRNNLTKPGVIALAKSLKIPTGNKTKMWLCKEISGKLII